MAPPRRRPAATSVAPPRRRLEPAVPLYQQPELYDVAFGFRDVPTECDGLLKLASRHGLARPKSVLELACGPAHHLRELVSRGLAGIGLDINPLMLQYARQLCRRDNVGARFERADMRAFHIAKRVDLALCLFDSFALCISDSDAIHTFRSTWRALRRRGLLILEFSHPADFFGSGRSRTLERWVESNKRLRVKTRFQFSRFDAIAETFVAHLQLEATDRQSGKRKRGVSMRWLQRMWFRSAVEFAALASGCFDIVGWYGDIDPAVALTSQANAWRMVVVLRGR